MTYHIRSTGQADADLDRRLGWLAERSPTAAARLAQRYRDSFDRLRTMPLSCGLAYENRSFDEEIRHLLFGVHPKRHYRALFAVRGEEVVILAIRAPGERPVLPEDIEPEDR